MTYVIKPFIVKLQVFINLHDIFINVLYSILMLSLNNNDLKFN